jgi:hypothetical protein
LQELTRVTMLIKGFEVDTKKKAAIFDEVLLKKFMAFEMVNPYWEDRQAVVLMAFFGCVCRSVVTDRWVHNHQQQGQAEE